MNKLVSLTCALALLALNVSAQPAVAPKQTSLFSLPETQLRPLMLDAHGQTIEQSTLMADSPRVMEPARAQTTLSNPQPAVSVSGSLVGQAISSARDGAFNQTIYRRLMEGGYLTRPPAKSDSLLDRGKEAIGSMFTPEPFHVGKSEWSCSVVTAIERQNPLCLLNPIVFNICW